MNHKRSAAGVLTAVLAWGLVVLPPGAAAAAPGQARAQATSTVTLLTGDKVILGGQHGAATVLPAKGRERTGFIQQKDHLGDLHVVPEDALDMLRGKRIDPRLFNVTKLARLGYHDAARQDIPLIISGGQGLAASKTRDLPSIQGAAVKVDKATGLRGFTQAQKIWFDGPVHATLDKSVPQIGAPEAWKSGHTGKGTTVAVLDTGVDATHPDLDDAVTDAQNFTDATTGAEDHHGHGTHVASTITGDHPKYGGVAPDTKVINGKVLNDYGGGAESWIIAGMEWAAAKGAKVINMSLGSPFPSDGTDPMSQAVNRITADTGALFVIAAGNSGGTLGSPGAADAALTVGAVDHNDQLAPFSSRGPRWGDSAIKPDITAPGVNIAAAKAKNGQIGTPVDDGHVRLSGTSMATPHVVGAAAILAGQHPDWQAGQLKSALMGSAKAHPTLSVFEQGAGRVDVARAVTQTVQASPASVSAGVAQWPHNDDVPITKTLSYTNSSASPVTLDLTAEVRGPNGTTVPAGMFTFSPSTLTIPAGGKAQATVSIDTKIDMPDGLYSGVVKAGDIRTPIAVDREVESYNVTLKFLGMDGQPVSRYSSRFVNLAAPQAFLPYHESGTVVARLPKGRFYFNSMIQDGDNFHITTEPEYVVTGDSTLVVDARATKPVGFTVDKPNAKSGSATLGFVRETSFEGGTGNYYIMGGFDTIFVAPSKTTAAPDQFNYFSEGRYAEPDGQDGFVNSPYLYNLYHEAKGKVPAELLNRVKDSELAKVRSENGSTAPGRYGSRENMVVQALPFTLNEFYTPDVPWYGSSAQLKTPDRWGDSESYQYTVRPRTFKLGTHTERWNSGVFGPAFVQNVDGVGDGARRLGDEVLFDVPLYSDPTPNRSGYASSTGSTTLSKDGTQVGSAPYAGYGFFQVPAGPGTFKLHTESTTDLTVSNKITADWTFKSDTVSGEEPQSLPLLAVRFAPKLDSQNRAPAAVPTVVPVTVDHNTGGTAKAPAIHVSHDDGTTWKPVPLLTIGGKWFTILVHPYGAKTVSLKASTKDADGNSVDQTIIRAFLLK
jgi:subtilisin family serine protease